MATVITRAHDAERLAAPIIDAHHRHLAALTILFCFTTAKRTRHGQTVYATAQKLSPLHRYLAAASDVSDDGPEFLILIGSDEWESLDLPQRKALLDHELTHCGLSEEGELTIVGHDLEEFRAIVERHGLWRPEVKAMADTMRQLAFVEMREPVGVH